MEAVAHAAEGHGPGGPAPEDAGDVVGPVIGPVHRQHHVADLPTQGRPAVDRVLAEDPGQLDPVVRPFAEPVQILGVDRDPQMPPRRGHLVVGAHLPRDRDPFARTEVRRVKQLPVRQDVQPVHGAGKPLHGQHEAIKPPPVVLVRKARRGIHDSAQPRLIDDRFFHWSTSFSNPETGYEAAFRNRTKGGSVRCALFSAIRRFCFSAIDHFSIDFLRGICYNKSAIENPRI